VHRLAVLGSPIEHSKSPALHRAAYAQLGLDWQYTAIDVDGSRLPAFLDTCDESWRGLSLTMPLKQDVLPLLDDVDELTVQAGAANTVLFDGSTRRGFNTDVGGIVRALGEHGLDAMRQGLLIGSGATAASALIAMAQLGAAQVRVLVRRPGAAFPLQELGIRLGLAVAEAPIADLATADGADLVVSTVPGGTDLGIAASDALTRHAVLLDAAYDPWPSRLALPWVAAGGTIVHGLGMLLHQALLQVRVFVNGDQHSRLDDEDAVLAVMRESLS